MYLKPFKIALSSDLSVVINFCAFGPHSKPPFLPNLSFGGELVGFSGISIHLLSFGIWSPRGK